MDEIKFVYFDIGGVAILDFSKTNKYQEMTDELGLPGEKSSEFWSLYSEYSEGINSARTDNNAIQEKLFSELSIEVAPEYNLLDDFINRFEPNYSLHPVVTSLKESYQVGLLTNMHPGMLDKIMALDLLPLVEWDVVVDSSKEGSEKPQRGFYELAEKRCGFSGEEIFFVDNFIENIEAAKELGWQTFLYDPADPEGSSKELGELFK